MINDYIITSVKYPFYISNFPEYTPLIYRGITATRNTEWIVIARLFLFKRNKEKQKAKKQKRITKISTSDLFLLAYFSILSVEFVIAIRDIYNAFSVSLFNGISTFVGYLMPKSFYLKNSLVVWVISTFLGYLTPNPFLYK